MSLTPEQERVLLCVLAGVALGAILGKLDDLLSCQKQLAGELLRLRSGVVALALVGRPEPCGCHEACAHCGLVPA